MADLLRLILAILASLFNSRARLEAENLVLRQQINVLRRRMPNRPALKNIDRLLFVWLYRWFPSTVGALRWHRVGFRAYWRWRSRNRVGRPKAPAECETMENMKKCPGRHVSKRGRFEAIDPPIVRSARIAAIAKRNDEASQRVKAGTSKDAARLKRKLFAEELVANGRNATRAAIAVGYAPHSAAVTGSRLLRDINVQTALREAEERLLENSRLTSEHVLRALERAIFADPRKLYDERVYSSPSTH
jgi:hypothetical protein